MNISLVSGRGPFPNTPEPQFSVNCSCSSNGHEWMRYFQRQINAELFIRQMNKRSMLVAEFNFTQIFTDEELDVHLAHKELLLREFTRLEEQCKKRTLENFRNPESFPCEVCRKKHENYHCCRQCNYDRHMCHFCGDSLGHGEISVCYSLPHWEE